MQADGLTDAACVLIATFFAERKEHVKINIKAYMERTTFKRWATKVNSWNLYIQYTFK